MLALATFRSRRARAAGLGTILLAVAFGLGGSSSALAPSRPVTQDRPFPIDLRRATVAELQRALSDRVVTSTGLVEAYVERIHKLDDAGPAVNAVRMLNPNAIREATLLDEERRLHRVRGPMHGIPVLLKDNIDVAGMPTTAGAMALAHSFPRADAFLVGRLRAAGAIVLGKTNLTEFGNFTSEGMPPGYSGLGGQVLNPYNVRLTPKGSSSGSAVAAATALAAVTVGTETSGSILGPAVANSAVGVKPTVGLVSRTGILPIAASQDTAGPITRSVADAAALLTAMTGVDPDSASSTCGPAAGIDYTKFLSVTALNGARIGVVNAPTGNDAKAFERALAVLGGRGATVVNVTVDTASLPPSVLLYEFKRDLNAYLARLPATAPMKSLHDVVEFNQAHVAKGAIRFGQTHLLAADAVNLDDPVARAAYENNRDQGIAAARARIDRVLRANRLNAIVFPGNGSDAIGARAQYPSVALPIGYDPTNRRPIGMTLLGTACSEARLLSLAYAYEQATQVWRPPSEVNPAQFR